MAVVEVAREEDNTNDAVMPFYATIEDGVTPLHEAAFNDHNSACIVLLRYSAKIEAESANGRTPLRLELQIGTNPRIAERRVQNLLSGPSIHLAEPMTTQ